MGTYGISADELLEGVININRAKEGEDNEGRVGLEEFLRSFEGDISGEALAEAWNHLASDWGWKEGLKTYDRY